MASNQDVAHAWANQTKPRLKSGSMYFEGNIVYSYGAHFPIARIMDDGAVLFTARSYSTTTAQHKTHVRHAIASGVTVYTVTDVLADLPEQHTNNAREMLKDVEEMTATACRARSGFDWRKERAEERAREFCAYVFACVPKGKKAGDHAPICAKLHKIARALSLKVEAGALFTPELIEKHKDASAKERKAKAERTRQESARITQDLDKWRAGDPGQTYNFKAFPCALRIAGDMIETSHGARVSLEAGRKLYVAWRALQSAGDFVSLTGQKCDGFTVREANAEQITIGCHRIPYAEADRLLRD